MNAFVRQMAALSVLWALCELLLPEGRTHRAVRLTAGVLVMTALLMSAGRLMEKQLPTLTALAPQVQSAASVSYAETALRAAANQVKADCQRLARRAGYQAEAKAYLTLDGAVERIELFVSPTEKTPLMTEEALQTMLAERYQAPITLTDGSDP